MPVEVFKVVHICGVLMIFAGLSGLVGLYNTGAPIRSGLRVAMAMIHGIGMLFVILSGFAIAGKLGYLNSIPLWIYLKLAIWLLLGVSMVMAKRKAQWGAGWLLAWVFLGSAAAYLALFKPV
jgi:hypothetical protein